MRRQGGEVFMSGVAMHYQTLLAEVYAWMFGGFEAGLRQNRALLDRLGLCRPKGSGHAVDLGAGCGFQTIPLAERGYKVIAIDSCERLLNELRAHAGTGPRICTAPGDLMEFECHLSGPVELVTCMTDTLLQLDSAEQVTMLFGRVLQALEEHGVLVLTFRDLTTELEGLDRFIPVRSDEGRLMQCFLEYEPGTVKVHDLLYRKEGGKWTLSKGFYRKLRLSREWVADQLLEAGFGRVESQVDHGWVTVIAEKRTVPDGRIKKQENTEGERI